MSIIYNMKNLTRPKEKSSHINSFFKLFPRGHYYELSGTIDNNILKQNPTHIISYLRERAPTPHEEKIYIIGNTKLNPDIDCIEKAIGLNKELNSEFKIINMSSNTDIAPRMDWWEINHKKLRYHNIIPYIHADNLEKHMHIEGDRSCINYNAYTNLLQIQLKAEDHKTYNTKKEIETLESIWSLMTDKTLSNSMGNIHTSFQGEVPK